VVNYLGTNSTGTAVDFYAIFGVGNSSTSISTIDPSGIALAGIQALDAKGEIQDGQLTELKQQLDTKTEEIQSLKERLARLELMLEQTTTGARHFWNRTGLQSEGLPEL